jgi:hypothetical protein
MKPSPLLAIPALAIALAFAGACSSAGDTGEDGVKAGQGASSSGAGTTGAGVAPTSDPPYADIEALHEQAIARTCSLNGGVCHNSKEYPDIHSVTTLLSAVRQPCNIAAAAHEDVNDVCEPAGDRLVIPSAGIDGIIARVEVSPADAETEDLTSVRIVLGAPAGGSDPSGAMDIEVQRGTDTYRFGEISYWGPAMVSSADADSVTLDLEGVDTSIKAFFDDRTYPWSDLMVRVGDPNGNGVLGGDQALRMIEPGDPMRSYLVLRLIDETYGDLMPRQCRTWDDQATRALGCWIAGLEVDDAGEVTNAYDPIDYDTCEFEPAGLGKCGTGEDPESIFARSCGGGSCHVGQDSPAAGLDLSPGKARAALVGIHSTQLTTMALVEPGDPVKSYLLCKLGDACAERVGAQMPSGLPPLSPQDLDALRVWIESGAK